MEASDMKECKDCKAENRTGTPLNAPFPGPRCFRHHKARQQELRDAAAAERRRKTYGLGEGDYERILAVQGGCCGFCGRKKRKKGRNLAVDHDHECCPGHTSCGECTRGALCWTCNKFLQHIGDDPDTLLRGVEYLKNPPAKRTSIQIALPLQGEH